MRTRMKVLFAEPPVDPSEVRKTLGPVCDLRLADLDRDALLQEVGDVQGLFLRLRHRADAEVLAHAHNLEFLATPTTGLTHVDVREAEARGVSVISLQGRADFLRSVRSTAEFTIALTLALARNIAEARDSVLRGEWERDRFRGTQLDGKTVGVVGYGRLGKMVVELFLGFRCDLLAADPNVEDGGVASPVAMVPLNVLLARSDVVTLHASYESGAPPILGAAEFSVIKPGALLINTARGELVDEDALVAALGEGHLGGAALDVLAVESAGVAKAHRLVEYARAHTHLLITPHLGGATIEAMARSEQLIITEIRRWIEARA